jgi:hypothetical protein
LARREETMTTDTKFALIKVQLVIERTLRWQRWRTCYLASSPTPDEIVSAVADGFRDLGLTVYADAIQKAADQIARGKLPDGDAEYVAGTNRAAGDPDRVRHAAERVAAKLLPPLSPEDDPASLVSEIAARIAMDLDQ